MKLSPELVERTLSQFDAQALPDDHPSLPELSRLFGEHTFFLDEVGLNIVVPDDEQEQAGEVVRVAAWQDAQRTALASHDPEAIGLVVELGSKNRRFIH